MIETTYQDQRLGISTSEAGDLAKIYWIQEGHERMIDITDLVEALNLWDAFESIATGEPVSSIYARRQSEIERKQAKEIVELREQLRAVLQRRIVA